MEIELGNLASFESFGKNRVRHFVDRFIYLQDIMEKFFRGMEKTYSSSL